MRVSIVLALIAAVCTGCSQKIYSICEAEQDQASFVGYVVEGEVNIISTHIEGAYYETHCNPEGGGFAVGAIPDRAMEQQFTDLDVQSAMSGNTKIISAFVTGRVRRADRGGYAIDILKWKRVRLVPAASTENVKWWLRQMNIPAR